jgi:hypothetical protein
MPRRELPDVKKSKSPKPHEIEDDLAVIPAKEKKTQEKQALDWGWADATCRASSRLPPVI